MLSGESFPVLKSEGDSVIAGTINGAGSLAVRVSRLPGKNTITDIANLVEQAQSSKPRVQDLADKAASYFIPAVVVTSVVVTIIWVVVSLQVREQSASAAIGTAISYGIAVLAVSCPCALGLAVPMVLVVAGGVAARAGVIIKTADVTERGYKVTDVIFDKTGTLTEGNLEIVEDHILDVPALPSAKTHALVNALVKNNRHPVAQAVANVLQKRAVEPMEVADLQSIPGSGVEGTWNGRLVRAGNPYWLEADRNPQVAQLISRGLTLLCVEIDTHLAAVFGMQSTLRPEAKTVVQDLQKRTISVHIVSGDGRSVVENVTVHLRIPLSHTAAMRTPRQKKDYVNNLMRDGKTTLFCGDGTNDAVAVAQAHVGVQIESSSDITRATADIAMVGNLSGVVYLLDVSKAAFRRIIFNFVWSAVYNVFAVLLAAGAFVRVRIPPAYAGLGEIVSVLPVILVALTVPKVTRKIGRVE